MSTLLNVHQLVKNYGKFKAVDGISFTIRAGQVLGFLGPNGAGKTTTIQMLIGITSPNGGKIEYFGQDFATHRQACLQRINFTSAFNTLLGRITVKENLLVYSELYNVQRPRKKIEELAEYFEMNDLLGELYQNLSAGQKTRVNLVKALLNDPELLLMDEPTASLDPDIADKTLTYIENLQRDRNLAILYTSHNMDEITRVCDEVIFLDQGKIVAQDTPLNLTKKISRSVLKLSFSVDKKIMAKYLDTHKQNYHFINDFQVHIDLEEKEIPKLIFGISKTDIWVTDIEIEKPSLEDVFLEIARK